jgi:hypothetical protein
MHPNILSPFSIDLPNLLFISHTNFSDLTCGFVRVKVFNTTFNNISVMFESCSWRYLLDTTLCGKFCEWLATGQWFYSGSSVFLQVIFCLLNFLNCTDIIYVSMHYGLFFTCESMHVRTIHYIWIHSIYVNECICSYLGNTFIPYLLTFKRWIIKGNGELRK